MSKPPARPNLGLVCLSFTEECRFRTITRSRFLSLTPTEQRKTLVNIYWDNVQRLHWTLGFCARRGIRLYRMTSAMFPMSDYAAGDAALRSMSAILSSIGRRLERLQMRMVIHPDQFVVLNSESKKVGRTSIRIMEKHALALDLMGVPQTPWSAMILHGGKSGRGDELVQIIRSLPDNIRNRLVLENDEYAYGSAEILDICRRAGVPMVFDNHHHAIKEHIADYNHPDFAKMLAAARTTWPDPAWQLVHLSNGHADFLDRYHSEFITMIPTCYRDLEWIEVEARGKEVAIARLQETWGNSPRMNTNEHE